MSVERAVGSWTNAELFARATAVTPGGVHSPVRAFRSVGAPPIAIVEARGARVWDAEGHEYLDWIGAWGPALLGHAHPAIVTAVQHAAERGLVFGLASPPEIELAERVIDRLPFCQQIRFTVTGTEAAITAVRIARAATKRPGIVKFAGGYHGHGDGFLIRAGSGATTLGIPDSPGVTKGAAADTWVARYNDLDDVERCFEESDGSIAAVIVEPVAGNMGCIPPQLGFLPGLRERCDRAGALLIFDEVITGFRLGPAGAAGRFGVTPDLVVLGKVLGGGMPLAALGGRTELMSLLAPAGPVYQAGTYAAHPLSVAAAVATLDVLDSDPDLYSRLEEASRRLARGLEEAAAHARVPLRVQRVGSMWTPFFSSNAMHAWEQASAVDVKRYGAFFRGMLRRGVLLPPSQFECAFLSLAHGEREIEQTLEAARAALEEVAA